MNSTAFFHPSTRDRHEKNKPLEVGQHIRCELHGGKDGILVDIFGDQSPSNIISIGRGVMMSGGNATLHVVYDDGSKSIVPECIVHGVQWQVYKSYATPDQVKAAIALHDQQEQEMKDKGKADKRAREEARAKILAENKGFLISRAENEKMSGQALGAKNLRKELNRAFPGVKFGITSEGFSMGCSIHLKWENGPTVKQVEQFSAKYQQGRFDGMTDCYDYADDRTWTECFGGAKYVSEDRSISKEMKEAIGRTLCTLQRVEYDGEDTRQLCGENDSDPLYRHVYQLTHHLALPKGYALTGARHRHQDEWKAFHSLPWVILEFTDEKGAKFSSIELSDEIQPISPEQMAENEKRFESFKTVATPPAVETPKPSRLANALELLETL